MKTILLTILFAASALAQEVADVSDSSAVKIKTLDQGVIASGTLRDTIANYPKLKDQLISETVKKLESEPEISAQHRAKILAEQKVELPKATVDKHNARIAKFGKAREDALLKAVKKAQENVEGIKLDLTAKQSDIDAQLKVLADGRALAAKAKARQDELAAAGIPISKETQKTVEAVQPKPEPPAPTPAPTPDDGL